MQRSGVTKALKRILQQEPGLLALSERLAAGVAAGAAPAGAIASLTRNAAVQRLAPRLFGSLARNGGGAAAAASLHTRSGAASQLLRCELQQVRGGGRGGPQRGGCVRQLAICCPHRHPAPTRLT